MLDLKSLRHTSTLPFTTGVPSSHFRTAPKTGRKFKPSVSTLGASKTSFSKLVSLGSGAAFWLRATGARSC